MKVAMTKRTSSASLGGLDEERARLATANLKLVEDEYRLRDAVAKNESDVAKAEQNVEKLRRDLASAGELYQTSILRRDKTEQKLRQNLADQGDIREQIGQYSKRLRSSLPVKLEATSPQHTSNKRALPRGSLPGERRESQDGTSSGSGAESEDELNHSSATRSDPTQGDERKRRSVR
ncbi:hypothetical protein AC578_1457 [Pseudocercospora eumusae]|uniref:Uncharacterized protein n=1 Tax=Pseudocercospora eumusae TaxID=321146 RepID=A0A139H6K2_9PEZI|nr:hypothetical protein AC578_1457 [Pseudocercospora eumusae]